MIMIIHSSFIIHRFNNPVEHQTVDCSTCKEWVNEKMVPSASLLFKQLLHLQKLQEHWTANVENQGIVWLNMSQLVDVT